MKKNLQPLEMLVEETLVEYKNNETLIKKEDLIEMLEEALWLAPELCVKRTGAYSTTQVFSVCYKKSGRRINGSCDIVLENIRTGTRTIVVHGLNCPCPVYSTVIRKIKFNHEIL